MISARTDLGTIASTNLQLRKAGTPNHPSSKRLLAYAAAAGAVCSTQVAAEVVYTPAHDSLFNGTYFLDLNHDGINDFAFVANGRIAFLDQDDCVRVQPLVAGNRILAARTNFNWSRYAFCTTTGWQPAPVPLEAGAVIGPGAPFLKSASVLGGTGTAGSSHRNFGRWNRAGYRYLGLVFEINGKEHFGWARLSLTYPGLGSSNSASANDQKRCESGAICLAIGGYAYETIPGKPIVTGYTGLSTQSAPDPPTLGVLALGTPGLDLWRREEDEK
jgi:hypothetical protein